MKLSQGSVFGVYSAIVIVALATALWPFPKPLSEQWRSGMNPFTDFGAIRSSRAIPSADSYEPRLKTLVLSKNPTTEIVEMKSDRNARRPSLFSVSSDDQSLFVQFENTIGRLNEHGIMIWSASSSASKSRYTPSVAFGTATMLVQYPNGKLMRLETHSGQMLWSYRLRAKSFVVAEDTVFATTQELDRSTIVAMHLETGERIWSQTFESGLEVTSLSAIGRDVLAGFSGGEVLRLEGRSGDVLWRKLVEPRRPLNLAVSEDKALAWSANLMVALNGESGEVAAKYTSESGAFASVALHGDDGLYVTEAGVISGFGVKDLQSRWTRKDLSLKSAEFVSDIISFDSKNGVWAVMGNGRVDYIELATGKTLRTLLMKPGFEILARPIIQARSIVIPLREAHQFMRFQ